MLLFERGLEVSKTCVVLSKQTAEQLAWLTAYTMNAKLIRYYSQQDWRCACQCPLELTTGCRSRKTRHWLLYFMHYDFIKWLIPTVSWALPIVHHCVTKEAASCSQFLLRHCTVTLLLRVLGWTGKSSTKEHSSTLLRRKDSYKGNAALKISVKHSITSGRINKTVFVMDRHSETRRSFWSTGKTLP